MPTEILFYEYASCSTCRNARRWLEQRQIKFITIPICEKPPTAAQLQSYLKSSGLELKKFFNTSGVSYRSGGLADKLPHLSNTEALKLLAADGKLIKRPLLVNGATVLLGFREAEYAANFD